jgi:putative transposase
MEEAKKREVATFRFGVISDLVVSHTLERGEREKLLQEKAQRQWLIPYSRRTRISVSTLALWIRRYERGGRKLESLYPQGRADIGRSRALDEEVAQLLINLKKEKPQATVAGLIRDLRERKVLDPWAKICPTTVYRFLKSQGLLERGPQPVADRRRFEAECPNDLWQSDMMYGPAVQLEGRQRKTFLFAFLDDMSRLVPHAQFYLNEGLESYLDCLRQALLRRGLPRRLYVDNGPAFRSQHLAQITASLGVALIHSTPYQPEGRGKVERWFRTVRGDFLSWWRGKDLEDLNASLRRWLEQTYHRRVHSITNQQPLERFSSHLECMRPAPPNLEDFFRKRTLRNVAKDRSISLQGRLYEAPLCLLGKRVVLFYHDRDPARVEVFWEDRSYGFLTLLDERVNSRIHRNNPHLMHIEGPRPGFQAGKLRLGEEERR